MDDQELHEYNMDLNHAQPDLCNVSGDPIDACACYYCDDDRRLAREDEAFDLETER